MITIGSYYYCPQDEIKIFADQFLDLLRDNYYITESGIPYFQVIKNKELCTEFKFCLMSSLKTSLEESIYTKGFWSFLPEKFGCIISDYDLAMMDCSTNCIDSFLHKKYPTVSRRTLSLAAFFCTNHRRKLLYFISRLMIKIILNMEYVRGFPSNIKPLYSEEIHHFLQNEYFYIQERKKMKKMKMELLLENERRSTEIDLLKQEKEEINSQRNEIEAQKREIDLEKEKIYNIYQSLKKCNHLLSNILDISHLSDDSSNDVSIPQSRSI